MRETHEWTEQELDFLQQWYVLRGTAFIRARFPHLTQNACRQMATRLNLSDDLREYTTLTDVAEEAGLSPQAVHQYVQRHALRKFARRWGRHTLLPLPVVNLILTDVRRPVRPRGWWGTARTADHLNVTEGRVRCLITAGHLDAVQCGRTYFIDPQSVTAYVRTQPAPPPLTSIKVASLATMLGTTRQALMHDLKRTGTPVTIHRRPRQHRAAYVTRTHAETHLTALGRHQADVQRTLALILELERAGK